MRKKVLFLCTGNAARSQMAEAILNNKYGDVFIAYSAGTDPATQVNPFAIKTMQLMGINISDKQPKSIEVYSDEEFDFVITLCNKANEHCIDCIGKPIFSHWDLPDPADFEGTEIEIMRKFNEILKMLNTRIGYFANIPLERLDRMSIDTKVMEIDSIANQK